MIAITPLQEAQRKKKRLIRLLEDSRKDKATLLKAMKGLKREYLRGQISNEAFIIRQDALLGTNTIGEWKKYYDDTAKLLMGEISKTDRRIAILKSQPAYMKLAAPIPVAVMLAVILIFGFLVLKPAFIGFVTFEGTMETADDINISFSQSQNFTWTPSTVGEMSSLSISGVASVEGETVVKIYKDNESYVVFNSSVAEAVDYPDMGSEEVANIAIAGSSIIERDENITLDISLEYKSNTTLDVEDNGVESTGGYIDFTVENTMTDLNISHLCTIWSVNDRYRECYGNGLCCDFVEVERYEEEWDKPFDIYYGLENITSLENNVTAQVWHVDYNLSVPYSHIYASDIMQLPATFFYRGFAFEGECVDTCLLEGFNESNYTVEVTVTDARLDTSAFNYSLLLTEDIEETVQGRAEIGKPVKWNKTKRSGTAKEMSVRIPERALNFTVRDVNESVVKIRKNNTEKGLRTFKLEKRIEETEKRLESIKDKDNKITICGDNDRTRPVALEALESQMKKGGYIGPCGEENEELTDDVLALEGVRTEIEGLNDSVAVEYNSSEPEIVVVEPSMMIEVEYYTPAPVATERVISEFEKEVVVSAEEHYVDIFTYTSLPAEARADRVHLFWVVNDSRIEIEDVSKNDTDYNGLVDRLEWITPHLSNQTFVVEISAEGEYNLSEGTFVNTTFDGENVTLTDSAGYYISQVIDVNYEAEWKEINWTEELPYGDELSDLPNDILLMHMNEENGTIVDYSGSGNNGTGVGVEYGRTGVYDTGLGFADEDYVNVTGTFDVAPLTLEFWFRPNEDYDSGYVSLAGTNEYEVAIIDGRMNFERYGGNVSSNTTSWDKDEWYHIMAVDDREELAIYVNGVKENTGPIGRPFIIQSGNGTAVAAFLNSGNILLDGMCTAGTCIAPADGAFIFQSPSGNTVAYIDSGGNMCAADCNDEDDGCDDAGDGSFIVQDASGKNVSYIDANGNLCLIGEIKNNNEV